MLVEVPAPPWYQSVRNWSWYLPSRTAWQAFSIRASFSFFMAPTSVLARAAGLDAVVGGGRDLLLPQEVLLDTELLGAGREGETAQREGQDGDTSDHASLHGRLA